MLVPQLLLLLCPQATDRHTQAFFERSIACGVAEHVKVEVKVTKAAGFIALAGMAYHTAAGAQQRSSSRRTARASRTIIIPVNYCCRLSLRQYAPT